MAEIAEFEAEKTNLTEVFTAMTALRGRSFSAAASEVWQRMERAMGDAVLVRVRVHLSDIANQLPVLRELYPKDVYWVAVGQPPAGGAYLAIEAYAVRGAAAVTRDAAGLQLKLRHYMLDYFADPESEVQELDSAAQTDAEFEFAERRINAAGGTLADNLLRTWIYCRDIDNHYAGLVAARREFFRARGLTEKTHYIASTGIAGISERPGRLVRMDSLALYGAKPAQIEYMQAPEYLSETYRYGVTFERGVRVVFQDRSHYYLSGTASIDRDGRTLHTGDVYNQTIRMIENVRALLENHGSELADLKQAVVYLRDPADAGVVESVLARNLCPDTARIMVAAPVCRPGWLVEMDGIAVRANGDEKFEPFE